MTASRLNIVRENSLHRSITAFIGSWQLMNVCGKEIRVQGRLIRTARLEGDKYTFLDDPEALLDGLRKCKMRIDLFTFMQKVPETLPKHTYPMEWDNLAALSVSTFDS